MTLNGNKHIEETPKNIFSEIVNGGYVDPETNDKTFSFDGPQPDICSPEEPLAPQSRRAQRRRIMSLEVPVFLLFLSLLLAGSVMTNQELYQTCATIYNYNKSACEPLRGILPKTEEAKIIEKQIQPYVAKISMANTIMHNVWPGILVLFIGPWSDKYGRRPILLVNFAAAFIGHIITAIMVGVSEVIALNPWFYLLGSLPSTLVGAGCSMMTIVFCYIADVSDEESMPKRMFYVEIAMGMGALLGSVLSSYVLLVLSVSNICLTSAALMFMGLIYVFFYIGESLDVAETSFSHKAKNFFDIKLIKELITTCITRRPNYGRAIISFIILISMLSNFVMHGENGVFYLFLRNKFNVTLRQFTYYTAIMILIKIVGCGLAFALFRKLLKLSCAAVCIISIFGGIMSSITRALADSFWQIYLAASFSFMAAITTPMLQSIISVVVPSSEIGKVFSLTSFFSTFAPLIASPLYTLVYNKTLNFYPGMYNFISAGLCVVCLMLIIIVFIFERRAHKRVNKAKMEAEETDQRSKPDKAI